LARENSGRIGDGILEPAIRVENLSKLYHIGRTQQRHETLLDALMDGVKRLNVPTFPRSNVTKFNVLTFQRNSVWVIMTLIDYQSNSRTGITLYLPSIDPNYYPGMEIT